ncbi:hypothetical protein GCM10012287_16990 [Streptomyces daqingensis]|uniref:Uncharacterized protein n=1 Tax=Streptomyces daqingensis TaxID=1472640 RepID=A0ABQ2M3P6_9ACTN|nr:hypothetical protein [Streptomyces daqingensis]GGO46494.1 hypothetical protein GCM10012287_16990 [Streptomyces daqingensis]
MVPGPNLATPETDSLGADRSVSSLTSPRTVAYGAAGVAVSSPSPSATSLSPETSPWPTTFSLPRTTWLLSPVAVVAVVAVLGLVGSEGGRRAPARRSQRGHHGHGDPHLVRLISIPFGEEYAEQNLHQMRTEAIV